MEPPTSSQIRFLKHFRNSEKTPPVNLVVESGVLPRLVNLLSRNDLPLLQLEVAWAISNIACAEAQYARILIDSGMCSIDLDMSYTATAALKIQRLMCFYWLLS